MGSRQLDWYLEQRSTENHQMAKLYLVLKFSELPKVEKCEVERDM